MAQLLLLLTGALVVGAIVFGVAALMAGGEGLGEVEPDGRSVALPGARPLAERDVGGVRFDIALRGYRMSQVDRALKRMAYDIGYKTELIQVLEAEAAALREGRQEDADVLRAVRDASADLPPTPPADDAVGGADEDSSVPAAAAADPGVLPVVDETADTDGTSAADGV
ncbi:MAG: DivIVA domain-containing protein, partial [Dactylosporangium sp.]|nr:DivIVA domain-containing protein [Dactylosporangium sp.]NNJ62835.1 DivIVA domain-containing protein [Dactylosporangium sp.]